MVKVSRITEDIVECIFERSNIRITNIQRRPFIVRGTSILKMYSFESDLNSLICKTVG